MQHGGLLRFLPQPGEDEQLSTLIARPGVRVERIVSHGHASPAGFWYDQDEHELVVLLTGRARLEVEGAGEIELGPGDWASLEARERHRVVWTDPDVDTVWLAVFTSDTPGARSSRKRRRV